MQASASRRPARSASLIIGHDHELDFRTDQERRQQEGILKAFVRGEMRGVMTPVKPVTTHLSRVLLSDTRAFKLKRALRLPFVDFSTIEQRRAACDAELQCNNALAGALYERVAPVTRGGDGRYCVDGIGEIVDWLVVMRRFDDTQQFDRLAERGALPVSLIEALVERVAAFHMSAPRVANAGHVAEYGELLDQLSSSEARLLKKSGARVRLTPALRAGLEVAGPAIERRRLQGRVRRGHGDLHLGNICILDGVPTPFDALEFDPRLATADVLYDLAFLIMELRRLGLAAGAEAVVRKYQECSEEGGSISALLPFFTAMRAAVRMAVCVEADDWTGAALYQAHGLRLSAPVVRTGKTISGLERPARRVGAAI